MKTTAQARPKRTPGASHPFALVDHTARPNSRGELDGGETPASWSGGCGHDFGAIRVHDASRPYGQTRAPTTDPRAEKLAHGVGLAAALGINMRFPAASTVVTSHRDDSQGRNLHPAETTTLEPLLGRSPASLRIHDGPKAAAVTRQVGAKAAAAGSQMYFGNRPRMETIQGRYLLAHEAAHALYHGATGDRTLHRATLNEMLVTKRVSDDVDTQARTLFREALDFFEYDFLPAVPVVVVADFTRLFELFGNFKEEAEYALGQNSNVLFNTARFGLRKLAALIRFSVDSFPEQVKQFKSDFNNVGRDGKRLRDQLQRIQNEVGESLTTSVSAGGGVGVNALAIKDEPEREARIQEQEMEQREWTNYYLENADEVINQSRNRVFIAPFEAAAQAVESGSAFVDGVLQGADAVTLSGTQKRGLVQNFAALLFLDGQFARGMGVGIAEDVLETLKSLLDVGNALDALTELGVQVLTPGGEKVARAMGIELGGSLKGDLGKLAEMSAPDFAFKLGQILGPLIADIALWIATGGTAAAAKLGLKIGARAARIAKMLRRTGPGKATLRRFGSKRRRRRRTAEPETRTRETPADEQPPSEQPEIEEPPLAKPAPEKAGANQTPKGGESTMAVGNTSSAVQAAEPELISIETPHVSETKTVPAPHPEAFTKQTPDAPKKKSRPARARRKRRSRRNRPKGAPEEITGSDYIEHSGAAGERVEKEVAKKLNAKTIKNLKIIEGTYIDDKKKLVYQHKYISSATTEKTIRDYIGDFQRSLANASRWEKARRSANELHKGELHFELPEKVDDPGIVKELQITVSGKRPANWAEVEASLRSHFNKTVRTQNKRLHIIFDESVTAEEVLLMQGQ